jgi:Helix-turn-helix domain
MKTENPTHIDRMPSYEDITDASLTPAAAAALLGRDKATVVDYCRTGKLPAVKILGTWRISRRYIHDLLTTAQKTLLGKEKKDEEPESDPEPESDLQQLRKRLREATDE